MNDAREELVRTIIMLQQDKELCALVRATMSISDESIGRPERISERIRLARGIWEAMAFAYRKGQIK